jgi:hypothetical protein
LPDDDVYYLSLDTALALRVLVVEPDDPDVAARDRAGHHLRTALEVLAGSGGQALEVRTRPATRVKAADFVEADIITLAGVPELLSGQLKALEERVRRGAGVVLFLGENLKPEFYNDRLYRPLNPTQGLLPMPLKEVAGPRPSHENPAPVTSLRWAHPLLAPLRDPVLGDLSQCHFRAFYRFGARPAAADTVLAWIDDDVPAVVERTIGTGRVILLNTTANDTWTNLPRLKSYVPLVDRLLAYLSSGGVRRSFEAGEAVRLPLPGWQAGETVTVRTPAGDTVKPTLVRGKGQTLLLLDTVSRPGVYRVERRDGATKGLSFVVNAARGDSVLTPVDAQILAAWWKPVPLEVVNADEANQRLAGESRPFLLWPWLVFLAAMLLLTEMYFVHRLCPRVNPTVTENVVHKRGLLRPAADSPANS